MSSIATGIALNNAGNALLGSSGSTNDTNSVGGRNDYAADLDHHDVKKQKDFQQIVNDVNSGNTNDLQAVFKTDSGLEGISKHHKEALMHDAKMVAASTNPTG